LEKDGLRIKALFTKKPGDPFYKQEYFIPGGEKDAVTVRDDFAAHTLEVRRAQLTEELKKQIPSSQTTEPSVLPVKQSVSLGSHSEAARLGGRE
jgi:hypothetical protein